LLFPSSRNLLVKANGFFAVVGVNPLLPEITIGKPVLDWITKHRDGAVAQVGQTESSRI
jgi:hypothetical protein